MPSAVRPIWQLRVTGRCTCGSSTSTWTPSREGASIPARPRALSHSPPIQTPILNRFSHRAWLKRRRLVEIGDPSPASADRRRANHRSVNIIPRHCKHAITPQALDLGRVPLQRCSIATARADGVTGTPTQRSHHRVRWAGNHGPPLGPPGHNLQRGPGHTEGPIVYFEDGFIWSKTKDFVPRTPPHVAVQVAAHTSPLRYLGHALRLRSAFLYLGRQAGRRQPRRRPLKASTAASHKPRAMTASSHHANDLRLIRAPFALREAIRVPGASAVDRARCRCCTATGRFRGSTWWDPRR